MTTSLENEKTKNPNKKVVAKTLKLWFWSILHLGRWYLPNIPEIKPNQLLDKLKSNNIPLLLDIREKSDVAKLGYIEHTKFFPYFDFLAHLDKIPNDKDTEIITICPGGGASLVIAEILISEGYTNVKSLKGGIKNWHKKKFPLVKFDEKQSISLPIDEKLPLVKETNIQNNDFEVSFTVDARNLSCPGPVLESRKAMKKMTIGQVVEILTTDPGSLRDIPAWAVNTKQELLSYSEINSEEYRFLVKKIK